MYFDASSNKLYIGGTNAVYRLSSTLFQEAFVTIGPERDIVSCNQTGGVLSLSCTRSDQALNNDVQLLSYDAIDNTLIVCGTLYYGSCAKISLADFRLAQYRYQPVVPNDVTKSTVAVVVNIPGGTGLFVASAYSAVGVASLRNKVGLLAIRNLQSFDLSFQDANTASIISMLPTFQQNFRIDFISAFHYNGNVYFFARHNKSSSSDEIISCVACLCT
jgi:hypothetical protein